MTPHGNRICLCIGVLLGALAFVASAGAAVNAQINFQPATGATPAGYTADTGAAYSAATGRGWVREDSLSAATHTGLDLTANTRRRNTTVDTRQDTFIHMQFPSTSAAGGTTVKGAWEMAVPNGSYTVTASVGDPSYFDSVHRINVEGQTLIGNVTTSAAMPFRSATGTFTVNDGRITLDAIGGTNTKLDYVTIADAAPPSDTTAPVAPSGFAATAGDGQVTLDWNDSSESDLAGYRVYRSTSPSVPVSGTPLSGGSLLSSSAFTDSTAANGTTYYYVVVAVDSSGNVSAASTELSATPQSAPSAPSGQTPYNSAAFSLPGTIEAEQYDNGGEGVAYHDFDTAQHGSGFRATSGVDVTAAADTGGGYAVGWIRAGEWLEYTVSVPTAGNYDIGLRWASGVSGGRAHVDLNGTNVTGSMSLGGTGDWQTWTTIWANAVSLPAGTSVLRVSFDSSNGAPEIGNLNSIIVRNTDSVPPPSGAPQWPASFTAGAAAPQPRFESADAVVGNKVYAFGGFSDSQFHVNRTYVSYDATTGSWTTLGTLPVGMAETHLGITHDDRYIYFAGGFAGDLHANQSPSQVVDNKVWRYDTTTNTFVQLTTMPQPRGAGALVLVGRKLHYIGGNPADRVTDLGDHFVYDLDSGLWTTEPATPDPKDHASSAVIGSKIYILGGEKGHDQLHQQMNTAHVYDTVSETWTKLADMPVTKSHTEGGTFVSNGKIVMAGGQVDGFQATDTVIAYDPATDTWSSLSPSLPVVRQGAIVQPVGSRIVFGLGAQFTDKPQSGLWTGSLQ